MEYGGRVAQFYLGNVERHGVGRLNQGILHAFVPLRARGGQPHSYSGRQKGNLVVHNGFDLIVATNIENICLIHTSETNKNRLTSSTVY